MKYNVNVYQVVVNEENTSKEKEHVFIKGMFGKTPTTEEFNNFYETVLSLNIDNDMEDIMELCEYCFRILNSGRIESFKDVEDFNIIKPWRSLSVGDILEINDKLYIVKTFGFDEFLVETKESAN